MKEATPKKSKNRDVREIVLEILLDTERGSFSDHALEKGLRKNQFAAKTDRAFITRLTEGVTERRITLDYLIDRYAKTPAAKQKPLIRTVLRMGIYQLLYMDSVPDRAAVSESVRLAKTHGFERLSGFVNGVLRSVEREKEALPLPGREDPALFASVAYSVPLWLVKKLLAMYPAEAERIFKENFAARATSLRVNQTKTTVSALKALFSEAGISAEESKICPDCLKVEGYDFIRSMPGYREGFFSVQDESSAAAISTVPFPDRAVVWDVCAAPGGKSTAVAERILPSGGHVYAMDVAEEKLDRLAENAERLGLSECISICAHDATQSFASLSLPRPDVLLCDLPCSGLGVMARKNDIKYRLTEEGIASLVRLQREILENVCGYLKDGGHLLYSTCTVNREENEAQTAWFLSGHPEFSLCEEKLFLPGVDGCDGFYYALLVKENK